MVLTYPTKQTGIDLLTKKRISTGKSRHICIIRLPEDEQHDESIRDTIYLPRTKYHNLRLFRAPHVYGVPYRCADLLQVPQGMSISSCSYEN